MKLFIYTDGGARGNPGPAAVGVVIKKNTEAFGAPEVVTEFGKRIGEATNNVAEYTAVIEALRWLKNNSVVRDTDHSVIQFYLDSILVVNQLNGIFKVKDAKLRELLSAVRILEQETGGTIHYASVPREQNIRADFFVNQALDSTSAV